MAPEESRPDTADFEPDNLEIIDDIGPTYAAALYKIAIHRFADLAKHTPESLSKELQLKTSVRISAARIEAQDWIGKARDLARRVEPPNNEPHPTEQGDSGQEGVFRQPDDSGEANWQEYASFIITFERSIRDDNLEEWQTRVYKTENGGDQEPFPGLDPAPWIDWMFRLGKLPLPVESDLMGGTDSEPRVILPETSVQMMNEEGDEMGSNPASSSHRDTIKIKRGGSDVIYQKSPNLFVARAKTGMIVDENALVNTLGQPQTIIRHVGTVPSEGMAMFAIPDASKLEYTMDKLREAPEADVVSHVYTLDGVPGGEVIPTGTMTVQFQSNLAKEDREAILDEFGLEVVESLDYLPDGYTVQLTSASTLNPLKIAQALQAREELIRIAEPDLSFRVVLHHEPADDLYHLQWHLTNRGDDIGLVAGADVKAEQAWQHTRGSRNIKVCVIDDGFDLEHPEFNATGKIIDPRDFGQQDFDPNPVFDDNNHGTCCAGVALAEENGVGVVGLAPECAFIPVRFTESISDNTLVDYFRYAMDHGADVISCSWSASGWNFPLSEKIKAFLHKVATDGRGGKGSVILFAAGNESRPLNGVHMGRLSHQGFALHPDVIAVAASNSRDEQSHYSNFGDEIAICAPSSGAGGRGIVTTDRRGIKGYTSNDYCFDFGGTSSSTPLAAGLAALILSINGDLTAAQVKEVMMETADKIGNPADYVNGHSQKYGHGRINALEAVKRAAEMMNHDGTEENPDGDGEPGDENLGEPEDDSAEDLDILITSVTSPTELTGGLMRRLRTTLTFELSGSQKERIANSQPVFLVELFQKNTATQEIRFVSSDPDGRLQPQKFEYSSELDFLRPIPGTYELSSKVFVSLPAKKIKAEKSGPAFDVT